MIALGRQFRTQIPIAHLSSVDTLTPLFHARSARLPITSDTCPQYLSFVAEELPTAPRRSRALRRFAGARIASSCGPQWPGD